MQPTSIRSHIQLGDLLRGVANCETVATTELWRRLETRLKDLARRELYGTHRLLDEDDVALIVFASLCRWLAAGNVAKVTTHRQLIRFLTTANRRVVIDLHRYENRQSRGGREGFDHGYTVEQIADAAPGPAARVGHADEIMHLKRSLDGSLGELLSARLDGKNHRELARMFGCSVRSIERRMVHLRTAYMQWQSNRHYA